MYLQLVLPASEIFEGHYDIPAVAGPEAGVPQLMVHLTLDLAAAGRRPRGRIAIAAVAAAEAASFLFFSVSHLGVKIPLGFTKVAEPRIVPATVVEGLCGLVLAGSAVVVNADHPKAWATAVAAQAFSAGGVVLGMAALAAGRGPRTVLNDIYHRVMLVSLVCGIALLSTPFARRTLQGRRGTLA